MRHWLMKSEPDVFSIDHLQRDGRCWWTGVRNYQARNFMMKEMSVGDLVLFYHSNAEPPGVAGLARVSRPAAPDAEQFDPKSEYFDPKATQAAPRWHCVEVEFVEKFPRLVDLTEIRSQPKLASMLLLRPGQRLSIQPVNQQEFEFLKALAHTSPRVQLGGKHEPRQRSKSL